MAESPDSSPPSSFSPPTTRFPSSHCTRLKVAKFAGTYTNRTYDNFTFCATTDTGTSEYCNSTLVDLASLGPLDDNTVYARSPRIVKHFSMERTCGTDSDVSGTADFVMHIQNIYPDGYGKNTTAFSEQGGALLGPVWHVKCVVGGQSSEVVGCGSMDVEDGQWTKPSEGAVQDLGDVWWDKA